MLTTPWQLFLSAAREYKPSLCYEGKKVQSAISRDCLRNACHVPPSQRHVHVRRGIASQRQKLDNTFIQRHSLYILQTESIVADVRHFLLGKETFKTLPNMTFGFQQYRFLGTLSGLNCLLPALQSKRSEPLYVAPNKAQHHACAGHHRRRHLCE